MEPLPTEVERQSLLTSSAWGLKWLLPVLVLLAFLGDRIINGSKGQKQHERLLVELRQVPQMPESTIEKNFDYFSVWNSQKALVGASYNTKVSYAKIESFYDDQLASLGWRIASRGMDDVNWCKGEFGAQLRYGV